MEKQNNVEDIDNQIAKQKKWKVILLSAIIAVTIIGGILIYMEGIVYKSLF